MDSITTRSGHANNHPLDTDIFVGDELAAWVRPTYWSEPPGYTLYVFRRFINAGLPDLMKFDTREEAVNYAVTVLRLL